MVNDFYFFGMPLHGGIRPPSVLPSQPRKEQSSGNRVFSAQTNELPPVSAEGGNMINFMKTTGLAIGIALVSFAAPMPAGAQDMELRIGPDGVRPVIRDRDRDMDRRGPPRMRGCSEREARAAAREAGLRDPEVVRVTPGRVVVEGFTRRGPDRITFANERGCPEI